MNLEEAEKDLLKNKEFREIRKKNRLKFEIAPLDVVAAAKGIVIEFKALADKRQIKIVENYAAYFNANFQTVCENTRQNQSLATIRDTLLPKLMSGAIRVPVEMRRHRGHFWQFPLLW